MPRFEWPFIGLDFGQTLRQFNVHSPGFFSPHLTYCFTHDHRYRVGMANGLRPLSDRLEHAYDIHDLMRRLMQSTRRALAGQHQHGRPIHVAVGDTGD